MSNTKKGFVQLHLSVLLAGFTGLFGRLITLNEVDIVWYRMLFTSCILLVFTGLPRVGWRKFLQLCGCGALLGTHWILFYGSIKASNVSIGVICFSLIGFFTALFEPLLLKKRFSWLELLFSLITVVGVLCIFSLDARYRYGISIGVVSSAVCAVYAICNKKVSVGVRSRTVLMYQMTGGLVAVSAIIPPLSAVLPQPTARGGGPRRQQPVVHALPCLVLHRWHVLAANSGPEASLGLHRQPDLQSGALLHHCTCLHHLRRGARNQLLLLSGHYAHHAQCIAAKPASVEKRRNRPVGNDWQQPF